MMILRKGARKEGVGGFKHLGQRNESLFLQRGKILRHWYSRPLARSFILELKMTLRTF